MRWRVERLKQARIRLYNIAYGVAEGGYVRMHMVEDMRTMIRARFGRVVWTWGEEVVQG